MLSGLKLIHLPPSTALSLTACALGNVFVLKTCQRTLLIGFNQGPLQVLPDQQITANAEVIQGSEAYRFLLETICGLKSRIVGENEIVHQFKEAYQHFCEGQAPNSHVQKLLEKLFKDAKDIRSTYLLELGLMTYAGIVRKLAGESAQKEILVLGSGRLAEDIIKICARKYSITLCARNEERLAELSRTHNIQTVSWQQRENLHNLPFLVNTIGRKEAFLSDTFLRKWTDTHASTRRLVDLAEPSPFFHWQKSGAGVMLLEDIFKKAEGLDVKRETKIKKAHQAINDATIKRDETFTINLPFGWEELHFA
jgi:glutamyl-tRNA reductase